MWFLPRRTPFSRALTGTSLALPCMQRLPASQSGWLAAVNDAHVGKALRLLHANPVRDWTVDELAREVALSRSDARGWRGARDSTLIGNNADTEKAAVSHSLNRACLSRCVDDAVDSLATRVRIHHLQRRKKDIPIPAPKRSSEPGSGTGC